VREAHISWGFLTGSLVYKVKKTVDLGSQDFTFRDLRSHFGRQEVAFDDGVYSRPATALAYGKLLRLGQAERAQGRSVVLDAIGIHRVRRREALRLEGETGAAVVIGKGTNPIPQYRLPATPVVVVGSAIV